MPKVIDKQEIMEEILNAFEKCTFDKPLTLISMRDIANAAGMSHSKILQYFSTKDQLLKSYIRHVANDYVVSVETLFDKIEKYRILTKRDFIRNIIRVTYEQEDMLVHMRIFVQLYSLAQYDESINKIVNEVYKKWQDSICSYLTEVGIKIEEGTSKAMLGYIEGMLLLSINTSMTKEEAISYCELIINE